MATPQERLSADHDQRREPKQVTAIPIVRKRPIHLYDTAWELAVLHWFPQHNNQSSASQAPTDHVQNHQIGGVQRNGRLTNRTVTISIICFLVLIIILAIAVRKPFERMQCIVGVISLLLFLLSSLTILYDLVSRKSGEYKVVALTIRLLRIEDSGLVQKNRGNTLWTVTITIPLMSSLYIWLWWGQLNSSELQLSTAAEVGC